MALLQSFRRNIFRTGADFLKLCSAFTHNESGFREEVLKDVRKTGKETKLSKDPLTEIENSRKESDMPVEMENPFTSEKPQCVLCKYNIEPSYKNVRLLSQFVSSYTGRIYGRHITGLCQRKQKAVHKEIVKAQRAGLMGVYVKDPNFYNDPDLYDSSKPFKFL